jgi:hypothetical protein
MRCRHPSWDQESDRDQDAKPELAAQEVLPEPAAAKGPFAETPRSPDQPKQEQPLVSVGALAVEQGRNFALYHGRALLELAKYPAASQAFHNR